MSLTSIRRIRFLQADIREEVRKALLETLFASRTSLLVGACVGGSVAAYIAWSSRSEWVVTCALLIILTGALRLLSFCMFQRAGFLKNRSWEVIYDAGAWAYTALLGMLTLVTLLFSSDSELHLMAGALSTGYAAGAAGRNTGRPLVAVGQLFLCGLPLTIGLLLTPTFGHILLAVSNLLYVLVIMDVTLKTYHTVVAAFIERQEKLDLAEVYERVSRTDPLTGIYNRSTLKNYLEDVFSGGPVQQALIWIDLDHFKQINDTLGHPAGDVVLNAVASRLGEMLGGQGLLARFGGDEFIVSLAVRDTDHALEFAEDIRLALIEPIAVDGAQLDLSASVGVAVARLGEQSSDDLLRHADMALYHAKSKGRNCVAIFNPAMEERLLRTKRIENDLRRAIENGDLRLDYQPIIDIEAGCVRSCEALVRWHHPVLGNLPPDVFIPIAEASGQIQALTEWVLNAACAAAVHWPKDIRVSVNISPVLLKRRDLPHAVHAALLAQGLSPRKLELEITESVLVEENANTSIILSGFQNIGIRLALDDFGTGYSSLSYLCKYRFDTLKVDKSFTQRIDRSSEARAVIQAVSSIATSLGVTIVAEGVETADQLQFIRSQGCAAAQGYLFARPMREEAVADFLARYAEEGSLCTKGSEPVPTTGQRSVTWSGETGLPQVAASA